MLHFFLLLMAKNFSKSSISIGQNCVLCTKSHAWRCSRVNFHDFNMRTLTHFQIELFSHCTYTFHDFVRYQLMFLTVCTTKTKKNSNTSQLMNSNYVLMKFICVAFCRWLLFRETEFSDLSSFCSIFTWQMQAIRIFSIRKNAQNLRRIADRGISCRLSWAKPSAPHI